MFYVCGKVIIKSVQSESPKMTNHDALIFDIDGMLWNACAASAKQIESVAGLPFNDCIETLLPSLLNAYPHLLAAINEAELEVVEKVGGIFYEGAIDGIKLLSESYQIFLVSNCQDWYLKLFLELSGLEPLLAGYDCNGLSGLPKHDMLSNMKNKYDLKNPVYIGDTASDEAACKQADLNFIHVSYGFGIPINKCLSFDSFAAFVGYANTKI
jgi:phosphoglycolate phosphatase